MTIETGQSEPSKRLAWSIAALMTVCLGCSNGSAPAGGSAAKRPPAAAGHNHAHLHGPHGGPVLELGDEEFHAEWLLDEETGRLTVYLLDSTGKKEHPIDAPELMVNTTVAGESKSYKLAAVGEADKPTAKFEIEDQGLIAAIEGAGQDGTEAVLNVSIGGRDYAAKFEKHEH